MSVPIAVVSAPPQDSYPQGYNFFHGSPISLKSGSFQNRFYPAGSPAHSLGPIAMPDFKRGAWESDPSAWLDDELCRNYNCCGIALPDLHALVEHFESRHVEVIWPTPTQDDPDGTPAFDADDMDISEPSPSPPATPAQSAFDSVRVDVAMSACFRTPLSQYTSSYSSIAGANGPQAAFNRYAGYADYSSALPGTDPSPTYDLPEKHHQTPSSAPCVPPALLFSSSSSASPSPLNTPASSRTASPSLLPLHPQSTPKRPSPGLSLSKPFRCPKHGCNKSYKQQNGLKYHLSHGQCNFAPRDPAVEALSEAEREKRLRPFVCAVGAPKDCGRRYKNMNGLRYHYTHTGEHGARGLELLALGQHPLPDLSATSSPAQSMRSSPQPQHQQSQSQPQQPQPQQQQQQQQQQYVPAPHAAPIAVPSPFPIRAWED